MRLIMTIIALALLFAAPLLIFGNVFDEAFTGEKAVDYLRSFGAWAAIIGVLLIIADLILPTPSTSVMTLLGILYGPILGGALSAFASFSAGAIAYGITRRIGERAAKKIVGERDLRRAERFFQRGGGYAIAISRSLPLLPEVTSCLAGLSRMDRRAYYAALALGSGMTGFAYALIGHLGSDKPWQGMLMGSLLPLALWPIAKRLTSGRGAPDKPLSDNSPTPADTPRP